VRTSRWVLLPGATLLLTFIGVVLPQHAGPVALLAVVAPYWYALLLLSLVPLAVMRRDAFLAAIVGVASVAAVLAYPATPDAQRTSTPVNLGLVTWNLHGEDPATVGLSDALERWQPDVVVLQEADDAALTLLPDGMVPIRRPDAATPPGMLIATRLPVIAHGEVQPAASAWDRPRALWMSVRVSGELVTVVGVHLSFPMPVDSLPCPYCPDRRDAQIRLLADFVRERQLMGERVVLAGDFNLADREVGYDGLSFLTDADRSPTWRPIAASWFPAVLRLDYVFGGDGIGVVQSAVDCAISSSDHCPIHVELALIE
jgi:endonuclease/exonuclease/phosphatase (EEP) superfamily protein YafD